MKLAKDNRAQIRIIEAFFASILILGAVALIPSQPSAGNSNQNALNFNALDVLATLDRDGFLAELIENASWVALKKSAESSLSPAVWFNLTVFDENMRPINDVPICSGSPISQKITASDYICANPSRSYTIYIMRLQLASVT